MTRYTLTETDRNTLDNALTTAAETFEKLAAALLADAETERIAPRAATFRQLAAQMNRQAVDVRVLACKLIDADDITT